MPAPNLYTVQAVVDLIYSLPCMFYCPNINHVLQNILSEISNASILFAWIMTRKKIIAKQDKSEKWSIDCFHDPIMQYVLGGSLHKNNTIYLPLGLYHASVNLLSIVSM